MQAAAINSKQQARERGDMQGYRMQEMLEMDKNICGRSDHNIIRQV